jgi:predicted component of type VI protein secretion system
MREILWQDSDSTTRVRAVPPLAEAVTDSTLHLQLAVREIVLDEHSPPLQLGRERHAGLVVEAQWVSRQHAQIEYRRGFFVLTDVSTNGTYVTLPGGDTVVLHRNQLPLRGGGTISLGREPELNAALLVRYECR